MIQRVAVAVGVSNQRSLAWHSAMALLRGNEFDHVIVTYQNERFERSVGKLVEEQNAAFRKSMESTCSFHSNSNSISNSTGSASAGASVTAKRLSSLQLDVTKEDEVQSLFEERLPSLLSSTSNSNNGHEFELNAIVHSVAYAPPSAMKSSPHTLPLLHTDLESFEIAHSVSSYSLITLAKHALPLLSCQTQTGIQTGTQTQNHTLNHTRSPSITTMTYLGSTRPVPNYNIMGSAKASLEATVRGLAYELSPPPHSIRINAISPGPVHTLAARGIKDFGTLKHQVDERSLLKRGVTVQEVGDVVAFVAGGRASGVTGQVWFVDGGYNSSSMGG